MRAYLHLIPTNSEKSVMYQVLDKDIDLKVGEIFHYTQEYYSRLDKEAKDLFVESGLKIGEYEIVNVEIQKNDYWGDIRLLFVKLK